MSKHTPGPWLQDGYGSVIDQSGRGVIFRGVSTLCAGSEERIAEAEANTRLATAAPDLLVALEAAVIAWDRVYPGMCGATDDFEEVEFREMQQARAAIAKARGES